MSEPRASLPFMSGTNTSVPGSSFDPVLTLASSLDAVPGSHAVLLGAGVSMSAGVPSAWGVEEHLIRRLAAAKGVPIPESAEPHDWYREHFGASATYEGLLGGLAPSRFDRQGVLREIFEPDTVDPSVTRPAPSTAHRALAEMAAVGAVRVFLTLNFDHLMEQALRDAGVEPTVVRTVDDLAGLAPLHTLPAVVVHLHGDYLTPTAMRNTEPELAEYEPDLVEFLRRTLREHALLIVGWSAQHDPALTAIVTSSLLERFQSYWVTPGHPTGPASELAAACRITHVNGLADDAVGRLGDAFAGIRARGSRHPLTVFDAVAATKCPWP